jgi:hypothetical protein
MQRQYERKPTTQNISNLVKIHKNKIIAAIIIVAAVMLIGYLFSGGTMPNSNTNGLGSIFDPLPTYKTALGSVNGYVSGPLGLPAVGATVIAAEQGGTAVTETQFVSIDGKYVFRDLPPGNYIIMAAFPDGSSKSLDNVRVGSGSIQTLNIQY